MRCYSHLSDDEREQIGLLKALGQSIGVIAKSISTKCPTKKSRTSSSLSISRRENASVSRRHSRRSSRAWQRRANPVLIDPLHLAPESTSCVKRHDHKR